jgi:acetyl-CoA carboxylase carboxyltransferase component
MDHEQLAADLERRRTKVHEMGGPAKLAARREQGLLNARERIAALCDPGSFSEIGEFAVSTRPEDAERTPADGIVTGYGAVDGRDIAVASFDLTTLGASSAANNMAKLGYLREHASRSGIPCVFLIESAGARMPDIQGARGMGRIGMSGQRGRERELALDLGRARPLLRHGHLVHGSGGHGDHAHVTPRCRCPARKSPRWH